MNLLKWLREGNDCSKCKYGWCCRTSYEYDEWEGGCYIKGEDYDEKACYLISPFKEILGELGKKKTEYYWAHEWDGIGEWYEKNEREKEKLSDLIRQKIIGVDGVLCWRDSEGNLVERDIDGALFDGVWEVRHEYEEFAHPFEYKKLSTEWKELILKTAKVLLRKTFGRLKPYVCK